ncbi:TerC family integral membrane protein, partial [Staphylococcus epidermidis APO27]
VFVCISVIITLIVVPFYMYINSRMKQINHINEKFLKERNKKDFDMEKFKKSIDIPSGNFIYKGIIPIILLIGLGLKISNHFSLKLPLLLIILLYIFTFISTFYYSSNFIKNIINKRYIRYIVLLAVSTVIIYLLSVEEQLFLVIFSIIIYLLSRLSFIKKLKDITKI